MNDRGPVGRPRRVDAETLPDAVEYLCERDLDLADVVGRWGAPPLWDREPGFATLVLIILEQQVSLASARAAFDRLVAAIGAPEPEPFLQLSDADLHGIGFSRQKTRYGRCLAEAVRDGTLDLARVSELDDDAARASLTALPGIGPWSADIYLLMALGRPDIWPVGDIALVNSYAARKRLPVAPATEEWPGLADTWRPWRSVGARILWHAYLSERAKRRAPSMP